MPLAEITQLVDDKLRSATLGRMADTAQRDRAIALALLQYSADAPLQQMLRLVNVNASSLAVPEGWAASWALDAVEAPVGQIPRATVDAAAYFDGLAWSILLAQPLVAPVVLVHYSRPHTVTDAASTAPAMHENAIACWATAELCRQMATARGHERDATIGAAMQSGSSASADLARRARDWLAEYRAELGLPDPDKRGQAAASAVASTRRERVRARYFTLNG